jgi:DNA-binding NarL/FixJ family response regulator
MICDWLTFCPTGYFLTGDRPVRALVADDQFLVRQGVISLLDDRFPNWSFLHSCHLAQLTGLLEATSDGAGIDLVITDLDLPGLHGSAGIRSLREAYPALRIALLTQTDDWNTIQNCLAAGAHGYLLKADAAEQLVRAIQTVVSGGVYLPPRLSDRVPPSSGCSVASPTSVMTGLTARQRDVLTLLVDGQSTKDIAKSLNLGIGTVKIHLGGIYRTLAVRNRAEAVARFHTAFSVTA